MTSIIRYYTREAGVRNLEREIAKIARKAVTQIIKKEAEHIVVSGENIDDFLGVKKSFAMVWPKRKIRSVS